MKQGYTHTVSYYKKVADYGWLFHSFRTTPDALKLHLLQLHRQQLQGVVRNIDAVEVK